MNTKTIAELNKVAITLDNVGMTFYTFCILLLTC